MGVNGSIDTPTIAQVSQRVVPTAVASHSHPEKPLIIPRILDKSACASVSVVPGYALNITRDINGKSNFCITFCVVKQIASSHR